MEAQARTPRSRSRILGCASMFRFLRSLVGSKGSSRNSEKALAGSRSSSSQEQDATSPRMSRQGGRRRREPSHVMLPWALSVCSSHLPLQDTFVLGTGDLGTLNFSSTEVLRLRAQGIEVTSAPPRGSREVLGHQPEKKENGKKEVPTGEASGDSGALDRDRFAQDLEVEQGCQSLVQGPLLPSPNASTREEEEEGQCLVDGDLRVASSKVGSSPWNYFLSWYKQLQKSTMAKFPLKEGLSHEEKGEEGERKEENNLLKPCNPRIVARYSQLHKTFRSTDTVGFVESELKKILFVQRESRLWKVDGPGDRKLLTQPEMTLEEAGMVDGQHLLLEEMDEMGNWPPE